MINRLVPSPTAWYRLFTGLGEGSVPVSSAEAGTPSSRQCITMSGARIAALPRSGYSGKTTCTGFARAINFSDNKA
jgi:hypothetical protein